jgi:hypothetical protein
MPQCSVRNLACAILVLGSVGFSQTATEQNPGSPDTSTAVQSNAGGKLAESPALPDSPGTQRFQIASANPQAPPPQIPENQGPKTPDPIQPVGIAAAENIRTTGVAASAPAGAAIAPAKQKQTRSFLIKMGAVLGAGAALGTVAALSAGSPSRPPGAH